MASREITHLYALLTADTKQFTASMDAAIVKSEEARGSIGKMAVGVPLAIGAAAVAGGALAVKMAGQFETLTTQIVTGAGESVKNLGMIREGLLSMAGEVGGSPDDLARALYNVESAGFHGAAGLTVLRIAAEGAKVGGADLATVADAVTSALNAYGMGADSATSVTNDLIATVASGKMHMQDLAGAVGTILPEAAGLHIKLSEVSGALATMTMQGTDASTAATYLRFMLSSLANPTSKAASTMSEFGLSAKKVQDTLAKQGLSAALDEITTAIGKKFKPGSAEYIAALANMVGGTRGLNAALELTGQHMPVLQQNIATIAAAAGKGGTAVSGWALIQQDFNEKLGKAEGAAQALSIKVGTALLPVASGLADIFTKDVAPALGGFSDWVGSTGIPAAQQLVHWFGDEIVPPAEKVVDAVIKIGQGAEQMGAALLPVGEVVGGALLTGLKFIADHEQILITVFTVWAEKWAVVKALDMATQVKAFVTSFSLLNATGLDTVVTKWQTLTGKIEAAGVATETTAAEMAGAQGLGGVATETEAVATKAGMLGSALSLAGPIGMGVALLAPFVIENWGNITKAFEGSDQKLQDFKDNLAQTQQKAQQAIADTVTGMGAGFAEQFGAAGSAGAGHNAASQGLQDAIANAKATQAEIAQAQQQYQDAIRNAISAQGGGYQVYGSALPGGGEFFTNYSDAVKAATQVVDNSDIGQQINLMNREIANSSALIPDVVSKWGSFSGEAQQVFNTLAPAGGKADTAGISKFFDALKSHAGDATAALVSLQGSGDPAIQSIIDNLQNFATTDLSSTKTGFDNLKQAILNTESPAEQATKKGQDYADMLARSMFPNIDNVKGNLKFMADQITGGNIPALQAMIDQNPAAVNALMAQKGYVQDINGAWESMPKAISDAESALKTNVSKMLGSLGQLFGATPVSVTFHSPQSKPRATGGSFPASERTLVGERGPEVVEWGASGRVIPNVNIPSGGSMESATGGGDIHIHGDVVLPGVRDVAGFEHGMREFTLRRNKSGGRQHQYGALA